MAKRKGRHGDRQSETPENPAAIAPRTGAPVWRDPVIVLLLLLAGAATTYIWMNEPAMRQLGLTISGIVWALTLAGMLVRLHARRKVSELRAILAHGEFVNARLSPEITESQSGLHMRHVSAWLVAVLGLAATTVLWHTDAVERAVGGLSTLAVGSMVSAMLALAVSANAVNRLKARRLARDFKAALHSERLALGTIGALDVMISACLPTGERTRFNDCFLRFVGRTAGQMQGRGWLEVIHPDDRQAAVDLVGRPLKGKETSREHDLCVQHHDGDFVWLHETLVPRFDERGELVEFIGTAINITHQVENETALDKQIGGLQAELAEAKSELSKTKTSRNRFEKNLEEAREEVKNLQAALNKAEAAMAKTQADSAAKIQEIETDAEDRITAIEETAETRAGKLEDAVKNARTECQQLTTENKKLTRAFEKLQDEIGALRQQDGDLREQIARHIKETREAKAEVAEAHKNEAQHRAKSNRLTQRCQELEEQFAGHEQAIAAAQAQAEHAGAAMAEELERRTREVSAEALAEHLRGQLADMQRMTDELLNVAIDGPGHDAVHNAAATVRAMTDLVDQALGKTTRPAPTRAASFDLRRTAQGVRDLLIDDAQARGVQIEVEVASNVPALVHGDDVEIRTALMSLTDAALHLLSDGTLRLRFSEDVNTAAHSTIRCELSHGSAKVKNEALETTLAIKSTDGDMPDAVKQPLAHQAAKAWRTIRSLEGQHGYLLPDEGGFSVWCTFTLGRPAASASLRHEPAVERHFNGASDPESRSADGDPAPVSTIVPMSPNESSAARPMPRMPQEFLTCNLGEVAELGADSMRVFCAKPPKKDEVQITFNDVDLDIDLRAEVSWSKKISGRKHDVGLRFIGLTAAQQKRILRIAMQHRKVTTMLDIE